MGLTTGTAASLFAAGVDVITSGNHIWDKREIYPALESDERILRPHNYGTDGIPGRGWGVFEAADGTDVAVLNFQGRTYMIPIENPFTEADRLLDEGADTLPPVRVVDFHCEVTSEKNAFGIHLDGRVSAVVGTHTHVPTADERILPKGTAYQSDLGMTGPLHSVIGFDPATVLPRFMNGLPDPLRGRRLAGRLQRPPDRRRPGHRAGPRDRAPPAGPGARLMPREPPGAGGRPARPADAVAGRLPRPHEPLRRAPRCRPSWPPRPPRPASARSRSPTTTRWPGTASSSPPGAAPLPAGLERASRPSRSTPRRRDIADLPDDELHIVGLGVDPADDALRGAPRPPARAPGGAGSSGCVARLREIGLPVDAQLEGIDRGRRRGARAGRRSPGPSSPPGTPPTCPDAFARLDRPRQAGLRPPRGDRPASRRWRRSARRAASPCWPTSRARRGTLDVVAS